MTEQTIHPIDGAVIQTAEHLTIAHHHQAADGSEYLRDGDGYKRIVEPWAVADRITPIKAAESFGDVESWAAYITDRVAAGGLEEHVLVTWTQGGLRAVLDYHRLDGHPGRCQWTATHAFQKTRQFMAWEALASGRPIGQRELIEALEDRRDDVKDPPAADLLDMLRVLRGTVNSTAETHLGENGETAVSFNRQTGTSLTMPPYLTIAIPVLKGHTVPDDQGVLGEVPYKLDVRIRVSVTSSGQLEFRLSMPRAEATLEDAVADRVAAAKALLGDGYQLLRAGG
jgi:hypothetical protein